MEKVRFLRFLRDYAVEDASPTADGVWLYYSGEVVDILQRSPSPHPIAYYQAEQLINDGICMPVSPTPVYRPAPAPYSEWHPMKESVPPD